MENKIFIKTLVEKSEEIEKQISDLERQKKAIQDTIEIFRRDSISNELEIKDSKTYNKENYRAGWTMRKKVANIISTENRFLHISEIAKQIQLFEKPNGDVKSFIPKVRVVLASFKKDGKLVTYKPDDQLRNTVWGKPEWIENNKVIDKHMYNKAILYTPKEIDL